jgi:hypothetical protein
MKFICYGCDKPCILDAGDYAGLEVANLRCVVKNSGYCKWEKCNDGEVAKLPKLTAEVFDRPNCPEWAKWAAVDKNGYAHFYGSKPKIYDGRFMERYGEGNWDISGKFDASDWQNSLIERPAKLPDWCKVDAIGWHKRCGYFKVTYIDNVSKRADIQQMEDKSKGYLSFHTVCNETTQARLRPYNAEEMRGLVGKVVCGIEDKTFLVLSYSGNKVFFGEFGHTAEDLTLDIYKFPDGSRCGVLEHLEEGEWVK